MARRLLVFVLKVFGGLVLAGVVLGILMPLLPGLVRPWMAALVALLCIGGLLFATAGGPRPPD